MCSSDLFLTGTWPGSGSGSTGSIGTTGPFPGSSGRAAAFVLGGPVVPPFGPVLPVLRVLFGREPLGAFYVGR